MQSLTLFLLRFSTGSYLMIWGIIKLAAQPKAVQVSEKYYSGLISPDVLNYGLGIAEIVIGLLVVLGLFRKPVYIAQAAIYLVGLLAITPYIVDPFGLYWASEPKVTFYPSTTLFFASMAMLSFMSFDRWSLDVKLRKQA